MWFLAYLGVLLVLAVICTLMWRKARQVEDETSFQTPEPVENADAIRLGIGLTSTPGNIGF